ncbi:MAG: hypothetical protein WCE27_12625, partial [Pseudolabrys sp.]
ERFFLSMLEGQNPAVQNNHYKKLGLAFAARRQLMSALGQKRTFRDAGPMSALPPKADMCSATRHVRFVPKADMVGHLQRPNERDQLCVYFSNRTKQGWDFLHYC